MPYQAQEVTNIIISLIAEQLSITPDRIKRDSTLESLGADSLDQVEIIIKLQEQFGVEIDDDAADKIETVGQTIDYINLLLATSKE